MISLKSNLEDPEQAVDTSLPSENHQESMSTNKKEQPSEPDSNGTSRGQRNQSNVRKLDTAVAGGKEKAIQKYAVTQNECQSKQINKYRFSCDICQKGYTDKRLQWSYDETWREVPQVPDL